MFDTLEMWLTDLEQLAPVKTKVRQRRKSLADGTCSVAPPVRRASSPRPHASRVHVVSSRRRTSRPSTRLHARPGPRHAVGGSRTGREGSATPADRRPHCVDRGLRSHHFPRRRAPPEVAPVEALLDALAAKGTTRSCCSSRLAMPCPGSGRTVSLDLGLALAPPASSAGVAPEAANPGAVRPRPGAARAGASTGDECRAPRRNCVSPSRADEVTDGAAAVGSASAATRP